jgi:plastocyanin
MMNFLSTALLFSSLPLIHAQYGNSAKSSTTTAASSTTSTTSAASGVHTINVGEDGLTFNPASLTVASGDKVEFHFFPPDHSVVQASFANPCQPISSGGFFSGFFKTSEESVGLSNYNEPTIRG